MFRQQIGPQPSLHAVVEGASNDFGDGVYGMILTGTKTDGSKRPLECSGRGSCGEL